MCDIGLQTRDVRLSVVTIEWSEITGTYNSCKFSTAEITGLQNSIVAPQFPYPGKGLKM